MNTKALALAALLLLPGMARSQSPAEENAAYQNANLLKVENNYSAALRSANDGVIESALSLIARMKLALPEHRFEGLERECVNLITTGETPRIRYKAYLVLNLLGHPQLFTSESRTGYGNAEELFEAIAARLKVNDVSVNESAR